MTGKLFSDYTRVLSHTPYKAIGLNYIWRWQGPAEMLPELNLLVSGKKVPSKLNGYSMAFGGIMYGSAKNHKLRVQVEAPRKGEMTFNFNFHFDLKKGAVADIRRKATSFVKYRSVSEEILKTSILGELRE